MKPSRITASKGVLRGGLRRKGSQGVLLALLAAFYVTQSLLPAWRIVQHDRSAFDYATFHYAVQEALDDGDPYDTAALTLRGQLEETRRFVHPYLYPPAFLPFMVWSAPLSLHTGYVTWFWVNQFTLICLALAFRRWLDAPWLLLAFLFASFSPIYDNAAYGQVNLPALLFVVFGLWRNSGAVLALAVMFKMSPALYLVDWGVRGKWRAVAMCVGFAVGYGVLSLAVVQWDAQWTFFREVLPSLSTGVYNGLIVPIAFPINHSLPDLFNQLWPGPTLNTLDPKARAGSTLLIALAIAGLVWLSRRTGSGNPSSEACMAGAWTALITLLPIYTWEHHLVFLLLPLTAAGTAAVRGHLRRPEVALLVVGYLCVAWPIEFLAVARESVPGAAWWIQESKFIGTLLIGVMSAVASVRCPRAGDGEK